MFQYGRYLLIFSSREGVCEMLLQSHEKAAGNRVQAYNRTPVPILLP